MLTLLNLTQKSSLEDKNVSFFISKMGLYQNNIQTWMDKGTLFSCQIVLSTSFSIEDYKVKVLSNHISKKSVVVA